MAPETLREMTYDEALARMPEDHGVPGFWAGDAVTVARCLDAVRRGRVSPATHSAGGRPLCVVTYGAPEATLRHANFNSAVGARAPEAFLDHNQRTRPVVAFIGPVHGHETEGVTGLVNLVTVMETGSDLRGRPQPELRSLGDRCRLVILPVGNPDGLARFEPRLLNGMGLDDVRFWGQGTWDDDVLCGWPECKALHPMRGDRVGFLGCYFNDDGINPMHDEFFAPMSSEVVGILDLVRGERPDLVVLLHSHQHPPSLLRSAYVPLEVQEAVAALAARTYAHLDDLGLRHGGVFYPTAERGPFPAAFNLTSAVYHTSGAPAFTFECPHGITGEDAYAVTPEQILDIQLTLYRSILEQVLA
ncbi:MAG: hypothetical protein JXC32_18580 [Anaerolineae bacterium]|nr:hypothetical protein [Anaerolineae bacterium]